MQNALLSLATFLVMFWPVVPPCGPATTPNPQYPLHVRVLVAQRRNTNWGIQGFGRADLLGPQVHGVDYTYDCSYGLIHNMAKDEFYQARWKKPGQKMEVLLQEIGNNHVHKCDLDVTVKDAPYGRYR
jgi:hypothetical protein